MSRRNNRKREGVVGAILAFPDGILTLCCFAVPLVVIVLYSFWKIDLTTFTVTTNWNLGNYGDIFKSIYLQALLRSILITLATVVGCLLLGLPIAYFIASCKGKLQLLMIGAIVIPFWTSFVVRTYAWLELLGAHGVITQALVHMHLVADGTDLRYSTTAVIIGMVYSYLPMMILPVYSTFEQLDQPLLEAAADLGKTPSQAFFQIVMPSCGGGIVAGSLLVAHSSAWRIHHSGNPRRKQNVDDWQCHRQRIPNHRQLSARCGALVRAHGRSAAHHHRKADHAVEESTMKLRQHWFSAVMSAVVFVFLFLPIIVVFKDAFNANKTLLTWGGATFTWFGEALSSERFRSAFLTSIGIAVVVMLLSMVLASLGAIGMSKMSGKAKGAYDSLVFLRITLPEIVIVVGLFVVARMLGFKLGPAWVVIAQTLIYSAYAFVTISARLTNISGLYEKAAQDLGASQARIVWTITLPLLAPSIFVGGLLAFTFSLDSVVAPTFLGGPSAETIPLLIMGMIKKGVSAEVNAIGVIMSVFNFLVLLIVVKFIGIKQVAGSAVKGS